MAKEDLIVFLKRLLHTNEDRVSLRLSSDLMTLYRLSGRGRSIKTIIDTDMKRKTVMNLPDLATKLAEKENLTQREAEAAVKLMFRLFSNAMKKGDRIEIRGFGSFVLRDYKTYTGRNPKTGKDYRPKSSTYLLSWNCDRGHGRHFVIIALGCRK
jgi:integration host factor subunit beta